MSNSQQRNTKQYSKAKIRLRKYFESEVPMYILSDIETLGKIQRNEDNKGLGLCAIPQAMFLFAVVNLFGYLMKKSDKLQTREAFEYIFGICSKCNLEYPDACHLFIAKKLKVDYFVSSDRDFNEKNKDLILRRYPSFNKHHLCNPQEFWNIYNRSSNIRNSKRD